MHFYEHWEGQDSSLWLSNIKGPRNIFKINISPAIFSCPAPAKVMGAGGAQRGGGKGKVPELKGTLPFAVTVSSPSRDVLVLYSSIGFYICLFCSPWLRYMARNSTLMPQSFINRRIEKKELNFTFDDTGPWNATLDVVNGRETFLRYIYRLKFIHLGGEILWILNAWNQNVDYLFHPMAVFA